MIQYKIDTKLVNNYVLIDCWFKISSTFEFMIQFLQSNHNESNNNILGWQRPSQTNNNATSNEMKCN
jgi:hypothetical protein